MNFHEIWYLDENRRDLINEIKFCYEDGLNPNDYEINIIEDLEFCIEVEGQELPIPATLPSSKINTNMSQEDSDKVVRALKIKGVIAKRHTGINDDYFVAEDLI